MQDEIDTYKEYPVCRTCLNVIRCKSYRLQENSGCGDGLKISHVLRYIVPELYLGLSNSPEICGTCRESLRVAYSFKKLCLETETMIGNYLKNVRCTAQVIDLGAVINYLSTKRTQQNAEKITSEWEEDSEDSSTVDPSTRKIPITNLELLKTAVASVKHLTEKAASSDPKSRMAEPTSVLNEVIGNTTHKLDTQSSKQSNFFENDQFSSELFLNSTRKCYPVRRTPSLQTDLPEKQVCNEKTLTTTEDTDPLKFANGRPNQSKACNKELPREQQTVNRPSVIKETAQLKDPGPVTSTLTPRPMAPSDQNPFVKRLTVCEETGLLRNVYGDYFGIDGLPLREEQVEKEKAKAKIRGENLFKITNICTVTDEEFDRHLSKDKESTTSQKVASNDNQTNTTVNVTGGIIAKNNSETTPKKIFVKNIADLMPPVTRTQTPTADSETRSLLKPAYNILPKLLEAPCNTPTYGNLFSSIPENRSPPQLQPISKNPVESLVTSMPQIITKSSVFKVVQSTPVHQNPNSNILNFIINEHLRMPVMPESFIPINAGQVNNVSITDHKNTSREVLPKIDSTDSLWQTQTQNDLPDRQIDNIPAILRLKEEPLDYEDEIDAFYCGNESEDTLSAPDVDSGGYDGSWHNIINSLDEPSNNYVDVPDFVQINNVTVKDFEELRDQSKNTELTADSALNWIDNVISNQVADNQFSELPKTTAGNKPLPDRFSYNGKVLVRCGDFYKFDGDPDINDPVRRGKRGRRPKVKIVPISDSVKIGRGKTTQQERKSDSSPDRQVCVLFTSYSSDGLYINDHDYLIAPYVRNKVLVHEGTLSFCICFICGNKHWPNKHVEHMKSHSPNCPKCEISLGTSYMLNLHMKLHSQPCKTCTSVIPYADIEKHNDMHVKEAEDYEKDDKEEAKPQKELLPEVSKKVRKCFISTCTNTTKNCSKVFIKVPRKLVKHWMAALGRNCQYLRRYKLPNLHYAYYCCEDHFDMETDSQNWVEFKLMNSKLKMRNVVPHKFIQTQSPIPKHVSQLDEESKKIREQNIRKFPPKRYSSSDSSTDSNSEDEPGYLRDMEVPNTGIVKRLRSHSSRTSNSPQINKEHKDKSEKAKTESFSKSRRHSSRISNSPQTNKEQGNKNKKTDISVDDKAEANDSTGLHSHSSRISKSPQVSKETDSKDETSDVGVADITAENDPRHPNSTQIGEEHVNKNERTDIVPADKTAKKGSIGLGTHSLRMLRRLKVCKETVNRNEESDIVVADSAVDSTTLHSHSSRISNSPEVSKETDSKDKANDIDVTDITAENDSRHSDNPQICKEHANKNKRTDSVATDKASKRLSIRLNTHSKRISKRLRVSKVTDKKNEKTDIGVADIAVENDSTALHSPSSRISDSPQVSKETDSKDETSDIGVGGLIAETDPRHSNSPQISKEHVNKNERTDIVGTDKATKKESIRLTTRSLRISKRLKVCKETDKKNETIDIGVPDIPVENDSTALQSTLSRISNSPQASKETDSKDETSDIGVGGLIAENDPRHPYSKEHDNKNERIDIVATDKAADKESIRLTIRSPRISKRLKVCKATDNKNEKTDIVVPDISVENDSTALHSPSSRISNSPQASKETDSKDETSDVVVADITAENTCTQSNSPPIGKEHVNKNERTDIVTDDKAAKKESLRPESPGISQRLKVCKETDNKNEKTDAVVADTTMENKCPELRSRLLEISNSLQISTDSNNKNTKTDIDIADRRNENESSEFLSCQTQISNSPQVSKESDNKTKETDCNLVDIQSANQSQELRSCPTQMLDSPQISKGSDSGVADTTKTDSQELDSISRLHSGVADTTKKESTELDSISRLDSGVADTTKKESTELDSISRLDCGVVDTTKTDCTELDSINRLDCCVADTTKTDSTELGSVNLVSNQKTDDTIATDSLDDEVVERCKNKIVTKLSRIGNSYKIYDGNSEGVNSQNTLSDPYEFNEAEDTNKVTSKTKVSRHGRKRKRKEMTETVKADVGKAVVEGPRVLRSRVKKRLTKILK